MTVRALAHEAGEFFVTATRASSGGAFVKLIDDAPEWVGDLVREAHGDYMPDDWRYSTIREALEFIGESMDGVADLDDAACDFAGGHDVYTATLLAWVASDLQRTAYVDAAIQEGARTLAEALMRGQYEERREVFGAVLMALEERAEELEDAEDAEDEGDEEVAGA